jgi:thymidylate synthase
VKQYHDLLTYILEHGEITVDRTGVGTKSVFGYQMRFNLQQGFPAITTKKLAWKAVVGELLWFLEGSTDERRLAELTYGKTRENLIGKQTIWTANADAQGKELGYINNNLRKGLGPVYGAQWRNWRVKWLEKGFDQLYDLVNEIKTNPRSRRLILTAWNPVAIKDMALPPCHILAQFRVYNNTLNCQLYQRSGDVFLGIPFNIASYALLTHIIARECGLEVGDFILSLGDAHIYLNHIEQVKLQLTRNEFSLPRLVIHDSFNLCNRLENGMNLEDVNLFVLEDYKHYPAIPAPMAV